MKKIKRRKRFEGEDVDYLDEHFPKGDKRRGEAMVLLAIARLSQFKEDIDD